MRIIEWQTSLLERRTGNEVGNFAFAKGKRLITASALDVIRRDEFACYDFAFFKAQCLFGMMNGDSSSSLSKRERRTNV